MEAAVDLEDRDLSAELQAAFTLLDPDEGGNAPDGD